MLGPVNMCRLHLRADMQAKLGKGMGSALMGRNDQFGEYRDADSQPCRSLLRQQQFEEMRIGPTAFLPCS